MDDCHSRLDCLLKIVVTGSGTAVQSHEDAGRCLDLGNSLNIKTLFSFTVNHTLEQPVHVPDSWRQHINLGGIDELLCLLRSLSTPTPSGAFSRISEEAPIHPISPSTRMAGLIDLIASTALLVWTIFSSRGSPEPSKMTSSNPALAASSAFAIE
jgi:hypothetical protein